MQNELCQHTPLMVTCKQNFGNMQPDIRIKHVKQIGKYVRLILSSFAAASPCLIGNRYDVVKTTEPSWDLDKR